MRVKNATPGGYSFHDKAHDEGLHLFQEAIREVQTNLSENAQVTNYQLRAKEYLLA